VVPLLTIGGRIAKGFDFLGYSFEPKGLSIAPKTLANFLDRKTQLYEQGADVRRIGKYVRNWWRWVRAKNKYQPKLWKVGNGCLVLFIFFKTKVNI